MPIAPIQPSVSTGGLGTLLSAIASPGTDLHVTSATAVDEVTIYLSNSDTVTRRATIQWGGVAAKDGIAIDIPPGQGVFLAVPATRLGGAGAALNIKGFCPTANVITAFLVINRYTP